MRFVRRLPDGSESPPAPLVLADPHRVGIVAAELVLNRLAGAAARRGCCCRPGARRPAMYAALRAHAAAGQLPRARGDRPPARRVRRPRARRPAQLRGAAAGAAGRHPARRAAHARRRRRRPRGRGGPPRGRRSRRRRSTSRCSGSAATATSRSTSRRRGSPRASRGRLTATTREDAAAGFGGDRERAGRGADRRPGHALPRARADRARDGRGQGAALRAMLEEPVGPGSPGLAAARPPAPHGHLRPGCGVAAHPAAGLRERARAGRARPPGARHQRGAPHLRRVARAAAARGCGSARRRPSALSCSPATRPPAGLSEAEQMKAAWDEHVAPRCSRWPGGTPRRTPRGRCRSCSRSARSAHVTVVSSPWHLRVPWFFAPYRDSAFASPTGRRPRTGSGGACSARSCAARGTRPPAAGRRWPPCIRRLSRDRPAGGG